MISPEILLNLLQEHIFNSYIFSRIEIKISFKTDENLYDNFNFTFDNVNYTLLFQSRLIYGLYSHYIKENINDELINYCIIEIDIYTYN